MRLLFFIAAPFHPKARLFVNGRRKIFFRLEKSLQGNKHPLIWVHCASLGEFEQGRPIMEAFKRQKPDCKILLTFFSPSGYEVRKNYSGADYVFYLPWDLPGNARKLIKIANPSLAIFIKYEFWYHYTSELKKNSIPLVSASSIFRPDQVFFKGYGSFFRKMLRNFNHFFVQTQESKQLLSSVGITNTTLAGDTRFDRVYEITTKAEAIDVAKQFKGNDKVFVIGSLWPEDLDVLGPFIDEHRNTLKFIIAPHEISEDFLQAIEKNIRARSIRFSKATETNDLNSYTTLLIDNVGMLSRLYQYGEFAFVGGAYGKGLHNILEAACYGMPVFFGNRNYEKFREANELIMRGGAFAIADYGELKATYELLISRPENYLMACEVTQFYVKENLGATDKIMTYCTKLLKS